MKATGKDWFKKTSVENKYYEPYVVPSIPLPDECFNNWVLVEIDQKSVKVLINGNEISIDPTFEPEKNAPVTGFVISEKTHFDIEALGHSGSPEVEKGDRVYYHYLAFTNAMKASERRAYMVDGKLCMFVKYGSLFFAVRDGKRIMLNGYCLGEPIVVDPSTKLMKIPKYEVMNVMKVTEVGPPVDYMMDRRMVMEKDFIKPGDYVALHNSSDVPVEQDIFKTLDTKMYRFQQHQIRGRVEV